MRKYDEETLKNIQYEFFLWTFDTPTFVEVKEKNDDMLRTFSFKENWHVLQYKSLSLGPRVRQSATLDNLTLKTELPCSKILSGIS